MTTRSEIDKRSTSGWPRAKVPYDMGLRWNGEYRQDCLGYVSMCLGVPADGPGSWGGYSTVTIVSYGQVVSIPASDLKLGDIVGVMGRGTAGAKGHGIVFVRWLNDDPNDSRFVGREQAGGVKGWRERTFDWSDSYGAWRFVGVVEDDGTTGPEPVVELPSYDLPVFELGSRLLAQGAYGTDVKALQELLNARGASPALVVDGEFGPLTEGAVRAFQTAAAIAVDGVVGPQTLGALNAEPPAPSSGDGPVLRRPWPSYMPDGHYFGNIAGPEQSHGGFYAQEVDDVRAIQERLIAIGRPVGRFGADGVFGPATEAAVVKWQRDYYAASTSLPGQFWPDDWAHLFTY